MWFLLGEVAGEPEVGYSDMAVLVEQNVRRLQVSVHDVTLVHVLQTWMTSFYYQYSCLQRSKKESLEYRAIGIEVLA